MIDPTALEYTSASVLMLIKQVFPGIEPKRLKWFYEMEMGFDRCLVLTEDEQEFASSRGHRGLRLYLGVNGVEEHLIEIAPDNPDMVEVEAWLKARRGELVAACSDLAEVLGYRLN